MTTDAESESAIPRYRDPLCLIPVAAGLWWLLAGHGLWWLLCALVPGCLMIAGGVSLFLWPGEVKQTHYLALGGFLGVPLGLLAALGGNAGDALLAAAVSAAIFVFAGRAALRAAPQVAGAPVPPQELRVYAKSAVDEALLGFFVGVARFPGGELAERLCREAEALEQALHTNGWLDDPAAFHLAPAAPAQVTTIARRTAGVDYQQLRFASEFAPRGGLPGGERWGAHARNRDCSAWLHRHDAPGRPWLLCIHGYRMGYPWIDFRLFEPALLHQKYGLNLLMPLLPLHGPRRAGRMSGDLYLDGDLLDLLHAQTQALWDLRRHVAWIRAQEPQARIGVLGYSLGGYNASLLAAHEDGLEFVVAGIPVSDFVPLLWQHVPPPLRAFFAARGLDSGRYRNLLKVVSPLALPPKPAPERLHIFAGSADRVVPPDQPVNLMRHWQREAVWYPGGHLTFRGEPAVERCIEDAMVGAGWPLAGMRSEG
ncbi:MAG: hypothetical protein ISP90_12625 [Nevskia sp.]|nr:hypothetical protein [Nevskia sp.]